MFLLESSSTHLTQLNGKNTYGQPRPETALVYLRYADAFLCGSALISLKHILSIVACIEDFIPYKGINTTTKTGHIIFAVIGKGSVLSDGESKSESYAVDDILIEGRVLKKGYLVHTSLSILTVSFERNSRLFT